MTFLLHFDMVDSAPTFLLPLYIVGFVTTLVVTGIDLAFQMKRVGYSYGWLEFLVTFVIALGSWLSFIILLILYVDAFFEWWKKSGNSR
jgi:hypothetical protein